MMISHYSKISIMLLMSIVIVFSGCSSKKMMIEKDHLELIEEGVISLFNDAKDDLIRHVKQEKIDELEEEINTINIDNIYEENEQLLENIILLFEEAKEMLVVQNEVQEWVINSNEVDEEILLSLENKLEMFNDKKSYFNRHNRVLNNLKEDFQYRLEQEVLIQELESALNKLFNKNDKVKDDVTEEDYEKIKNLLKGLEDDVMEEIFADQMKQVKKKLKQIEKEKEEEKRLEEERRKEEEKKRQEEVRKAEEAKKAEQAKKEAAKKKEKRHKVVSEEVLATNSPTIVNGIVIANKNHPLPANYAPGESKEARAAFNKMAKSAKKSNINLVAFSTYRSFDYQVDLFNRYVAEDGFEKANTYSAQPGYSEHQTGLAFDINSSGNYFNETAGTKWMAENAHQFGFILRYPKGKDHITGYTYEPWHFRYIGESMAKEVYNSNLTLEEFLGM